MKKVIVLMMFSLIVSVSTAPAKILGIEFNEKLPENHGYTKMKGKKNIYFANKLKKLEVFDSFSMTTNDSGIVEFIRFKKIYDINVFSLGHDKRVIKKEFKSIISSLENKYGEFDKTDCDRILGTLGETNGFYISKFKESAKLYPVNDKIAVINLIVEGLKGGFEKDITISLTYISSAKYKQMSEIVEINNF